MKKVILIFAILFVSAIGGIGFADDGRVTENDDSIFQKMSDLINDKYEVKTVPFKQITIFQSMADKIEALNRGTEDK